MSVNRRTVAFTCTHCGACCRNLIMEYGPCHIGLFLLPWERELFPPLSVSPMWSTGMKGHSRPRPDIKVWQLNLNECPYITATNECQIYDKRPLVCQAAPLSLTVNPFTRRIEKASVDSKCPVDVGPRDGRKRDIRQLFADDIIKANLIHNNYVLRAFKMPIKHLILYDLQDKCWKELTPENMAAQVAAQKS